MNKQNRNGLTGAEHGPPEEGARARGTGGVLAVAERPRDAPHGSGNPAGDIVLSVHGAGRALDSQGAAP